MNTAILEEKYAGLGAIDLIIPTEGTDYFKDSYDPVTNTGLEINLEIQYRDKSCLRPKGI